MPVLQLPTNKKEVLRNLRSTFHMGLFDYSAGSLHTQRF